MIFGRDCFMIKNSDVVIVNLTDDISVGGSQEMLLAKYFGKPLIGIARKEGKFIKSEYDECGRIVENYVHPFVEIPCDFVVNDIEGAAEAIKRITNNGKIAAKKIDIIEESVNYYLQNYFEKDEVVKSILENW